MKDYEINEFTNAVIPLNENLTKIIEDDEEYVVSKKAIKIIDESCKFFGSSYQGRFDGSKQLLGPKIYKAPIIIEDSREIIYFPTGSSRAEDCSWISLKKVKNMRKKEYKTVIEFKNNKEIEIDVSFQSMNNQLLRASRLETILRQNKKA